MIYLINLDFFRIYVFIVVKLYKIANFYGNLTHTQSALPHV